MMEAPSQLLLFGSLPPFQTEASAIGLATAQALAHNCDLVYVIDDLSPPPPEDLGFKVMRVRDLRAGWDRYGSWSRLYILGGKGDSLFALELLRGVPGVVMPASRSAASLAEPLFRASEGWPGAHWRWLHRAHPAEAATLYSARFHHRRTSQAEAQEIPAFDLAFKDATALIAPSPACADMLRASGLSPDLTLDLPYVPAVKSDPSEAIRQILYVSVTSAAAQSVKHSLAVFPIGQALEHVPMHPAAQYLTAAIEDADVVVFCGQAHGSANPGLATALKAGKPVITASQPWARHLPKDAHLEIAHGQAHDALAVSVAALVQDRALVQTLRTNALKVAARAADAKTQTRWMEIILAPPIEADLYTVTKAMPRTQKAAPITEVETLKGSAVALIGSAPPSLVLEKILPVLDYARCPRFATPALAARIAEITHDHPARILSQIGFEAPLIKAGENPTQAPHRAPVDYSDIQADLLCDQAIAFGCTVDGAMNSDAFLAQAPKRPNLHFRIPFDEDDRNAPTRGFLKDTGIFWDHDIVRNCLQCIVMVGQSHANLRLRATDGSCAYMVADDRISTVISGDQSVQLVSDNLGLLEFRLLALESSAGIPFDSLNLRKHLAESGLILEWS